jgi:hypothetical protein
MRQNEQATWISVVAHQTTLGQYELIDFPWAVHVAPAATLRQEQAGLSSQSKPNWLA